MAAPALAADYSPPVKPGGAAVSVKTASVSTKRHYWPRYRVASWYSSHLRYADAVQPVSWGGRPVLLVVGIAF